MKNTKVKDLMVCNPEFVEVNATIEDAAIKMRKAGCGALPVGTKDYVEGIITDRDIVVRVVAEGKDPATEKIINHMSKALYSCKEDDTLKQAADHMRLHKVGRLIVRDKDGEAAGILSFGHILRNDADAEELASVVEHAVGQRVA